MGLSRRTRSTRERGRPCYRPIRQRHQRHDQRGDLDEHRQGRQGARLQRHHSNYVNLGNPVPLRITGSMTWSAWLFRDRQPARLTTARSWPSRAAAAGRAGWQFKKQPRHGPTHLRDRAFPSTAAATCSGTARRCVSSTPGTTIHGVYNAQAQTLDIYVNGVLDNGVLRGAVPASQFDPNQNVTGIGCCTGGFYFKGTIDEVRIYNRALTANTDPSRHEHPSRLAHEVGGPPRPPAEGLRQLTSVLTKLTSPPEHHKPGVVVGSNEGPRGARPASIGRRYHRRTVA